MRRTAASTSVVSKSSINWRSNVRPFFPAYRVYSSKIAVIDLQKPSRTRSVPNTDTDKEQTKTNEGVFSPVQHAAVATDNTSSAVFAFVAVYVYGLVVCEHELCYRVRY